MRGQGEAVWRRAPESPPQPGCTPKVDRCSVFCQSPPGDPARPGPGLHVFHGADRCRPCAQVPKKTLSTRPMRRPENLTNVKFTTPEPFRWTIMAPFTNQRKAS